MLFSEKISENWATSENHDEVDFDQNPGNEMSSEEDERNEPDLENSDNSEDDSECSEEGAHSAINFSSYVSDGEESEADFDSDDEHIADHDAHDNPLYPGARITVGESLTCILKFYLRHHQSDSCLSDLLSLIEMHCPEENKCAKTLYFFRKWLGKWEMPLTKHFYCSECYTKMEKVEDQCPVCFSYNSTCYFISIPLESQLGELFKRPGFYESLNHRFERQKENEDNLEDIYDGVIYQSYCNGTEKVNLASQSNISFTFSIDGLPLYISSNFNIWTQFFMINELSPKERRKKGNMLLTGLWFGPKKPHGNLYLEPLAADVAKLQEGIQLYVEDLHQHIDVRGVVLCSTCDLPAKAITLNMKQYNGTFGCHKCETKAKTMNHKRAYDQTENLKLRTTEDTERLAAQALAEGHSVRGVKGPTVMSYILPDFIRYTAIDPMHLLSGLGKDLFRMWFLPEHHKHPASMSTQFKTVRDRISSITPPSFVERLPRKIDDFSYWKASEIITWLLMYSIVTLTGIMSEAYLSHHQLLVSGIYLLYQKSVSEYDIGMARQLLHQYVKDYKRLYHVEFMTSNLHSLLHLADLVRDFGPLWVFTCFPFENANGILKLLVHATRDAQLQICKGASLYIILQGLHDRYIQEGSRSEVFYEKLDKKGIHRRKQHYITPSIAAVGHAKRLDNIPQDLRETLSQPYFHHRSIYRFHCLVKHGVFYSSTSYIRKVKTNSSCVAYTVDEQLLIGIIQTFVRVSDCVCKTGLCDDCINTAETLAIVRKCSPRSTFSTVEPNFTLNFINLLTIHDDVPPIVINVSQLQAVYFQITVNETNETFAVKPCFL